MRTGVLEGRDARLDFFRGFALFSIFINHIPNNPLGRWTPLNFGFCDSAEVFLLVSGCTAGLVYGKALNQSGVRATLARVLGRVGHLYCAHIGLLLVFVPLVLCATQLTGNPLYASEMAIGPFLEAPAKSIAMVTLLAFQPAFMNILPMYFAVLGLFALSLPLIKRSELSSIGLSVGLYVLAHVAGLAAPAYPTGVWYLNPFAWQLLFMIGFVACHNAEATRKWLFEPGRVRTMMTLASSVYVLFALALTLSWQIPSLYAIVHDSVLDTIIPHNKANLGGLRLAYILALAYLVVLVVPKQSRFLRSPFAGPFVLCGKHSLAVFCGGIVLSFLARVVVNEQGATAMNLLLINVLGLGALWGLAAILTRMATMNRDANAPSRSVAGTAGASAEIAIISTDGPRTAERI